MRIEAPPDAVDINSELRTWLFKLWFKINDDHISTSTTWNPAAIAAGAEEAKEVTVTGAELGDHAIASFSVDVADLILDAQVTAANTVTCVLANNTGGAINLASGTLYVRVFKNVT